MNFDEMVQTKDVAAPGRRGLEIRKRPGFVVGGIPTVSLLPREMRAAARVRSVRRALVGAVVLAVVIAGGSTAGAAAISSAAQSRLDAATAKSQSLVGQLARFSDIQSLQQSIFLGNAAVSVGSSTAIDWQAQIDAIEENLPIGYKVTSITADSANALTAYQQGATPLELPRAATVVMDVTGPSITGLPIWLRKLRSIPAYADATASVSSDDTVGYAVVLTIHLSPKALENAKATK